MARCSIRAERESGELSAIKGLGLPEESKALLVPPSVARRICGLVHFRLRGNHKDDIDEVANLVLAQLNQLLDARTPQDNWLRLGRVIATRRCADFIRKQRLLGEMVLLGHGVENLPDPSNNVSDYVQREWLNHISSTFRRAMEQVTQPGSQERVLVNLLLRHLASGDCPSLRCLGLELWPKRPQTACEKFAQIVARAQAQLAQEGVRG